MICNFDSLKFVWTIYFVFISFELGERLDDVKYVSTLLNSVLLNARKMKRDL